MKISIDDTELFSLTDTQKKVIQYDIPEGIFEEDMKRRVQWVLLHKYEQCFNQLKNEWDSKLAENGIEMIPTNKDLYAELVFSQPNYKCAQQRSDEAVIL